MSDVFISYSRKDSEFAKILHLRLTDEGRDVWIDWEDIPATADWWREIRSAIEEADVFAFIVSPNSVLSDICRDEIQHAIDNNKRFIPVLYQDIDDVDAPHVHSAIRSHNWIYFDNEAEFEESFQKLTDSFTTEPDYLRRHTRLLVRAKDWENNERQASYLIQGQELREFQQFQVDSQTRTPKLTELQFEYLLASQATQTRNQLRIAGFIVFAVIVLSLLGVFAYFQQQQIFTQNADSTISAQDKAFIAATAQSQGTQIAAQETRIAGVQVNATNIIVQANARNTQSALQGQIMNLEGTIVALLATDAVTATATPTETATSTATATATNTATATVTPTETATSTSTATNTATATLTLQASATVVSNEASAASITITETTEAEIALTRVVEDAIFATATQLALPTNTATATATYTAQPTSTSTATATATATMTATATATATLTDIPLPTATMPLPTPQVQTITYVVQTGDVAVDIAERFGVSTQAIAEANNINPSFLVVGQELLIPYELGVATDETLHVASSGNDMPDCGAIDVPCQSIKYAMSQAVGFAEIRVGAGVYVERLIITRDVAIAGQGIENTILTGDFTYNVITVNPNVSLTLVGITVTGGQAEWGAGIINYGDLNLLNVRISSNFADVTAGGVANIGVLNANNVEFVDNYAPYFADIYNAQNAVLFTDDMVEYTEETAIEQIDDPNSALSVGMLVRVTTTQGDRLNMRSEPNINAQNPSPLINGTPLLIIGGPQENNSFTWWQVQSPLGTIGWVVDFAGEQTLDRLDSP
ncbi:MAG: hypothetical protein Phog2KO_32550 [Phototrophicaceae bacterium]